MDGRQGALGHRFWMARSIRPPITSDDFEAVFRFVTVRHFWLMEEHASRADEWRANNIRWISHGLNFLKTWESEHLADRLF